MFHPYRNSLLIVMLLTFAVALLNTPVSTVHAQDPIIIDQATVGGNNFANGQVIGPSAQNPLFFHFMSDDSFSYTCKIFRIDEELFNDVANALDSPGFNPNSINLAGTEVSSDPCGTGTDGSIQYAQSFASGFFAFQVTGIPAGGAGTKTIYLFETQAGQAGPGGPESIAEANANVDVNKFWKKCDTITDPSNINLQKIRYEVQGRAKIENLKFDGNSLNLKIKTNSLDKKISGELSSASTEDFNIKKLDTLCFYDLPQKAGQQQEPGPTVVFSDTTFAAWNPPVPTCLDATNQYKREITYPFKVTSWIGKLKNADSSNIEIAFIVDATPKKQVTVQGMITIDDSDKSPNIVIASDPGVVCSGKRIVN